MAETTVWLKLRPKWNPYIPERLQSFKVVGVSQSKPTNFEGPTVKLKLNIPDKAFAPLAPVVTIKVPDEMLNFTPEVTVEMDES